MTRTTPLRRTILQFSQILLTDAFTFIFRSRRGDQPGLQRGASLAGRLGNLIGEIGQQARSASRSFEQQEAVLSAVQDRRDSVSGVSIDEEVAQLVKLQASFQANARVIATVQGLMQDLLDAI